MNWTHVKFGYNENMTEEERKQSGKRMLLKSIPAFNASLCVCMCGGSCWLISRGDIQYFCMYAWPTGGPLTSGQC